MKELVLLVGYTARGLTSSRPHRSLLHWCLGHPPRIPNLAQHDPYMIPRGLCGWYLCTPLVLDE